MVVREFVINGSSVRLNYSPDFYRQVAEVAGQAVTPRTIVAVVRANPRLFPSTVRIELVKEDLRTLRYVPVSESFLNGIIDVRLNWVSIRPFYKCPHGQYFPAKEQAIACACLKKTMVKK